MKKLLAPIAVVIAGATTNCGGNLENQKVQPAPVKPAASSVNTTFPAIAEVKDPVREKLKNVLQIFGSDLCKASDQKKITVRPFALSTKEIKEALDDEADLQHYGIYKKITPADLQKAAELFKKDRPTQLPFCYSYNAFESAVEKLKLPKALADKTKDCFEKNEPDQDTSPRRSNLFWTVEEKLRKNGSALPLTICIGYDGGDYGQSSAEYKNNAWEVQPSCWEAVAASYFGYPPQNVSPYTEYLASRKEGVINTHDCIDNLVMKGN